MLKTAACAVLIGLVGCQYIKPISMVVGALVGRQERVVYVEVPVPQANGEPAARATPPTTGE
jgi:hypothetical protein